jgi:acyl-CoA reductase-like NAD-dependent aldehyde dehydrogenase
MSDATETAIVESARPEVRRFLGEAQGLLIDGERSAAEGGATFDTINPADGSVLASVAHASPADVDRAVAAARAALHGPWGAMPAVERARLLNRLADLLEEHGDELAQLESLDVGNPVSFTSVVDVPLSVDQYRYFAGWATKIEGSTVPNMYPQTHVRVEHEPVGVVAAIVPWNFPLVIASWKVAPALAAGCTVVLKPAEQTPLTALRLGELALEAGIPPGVLNVCPGLGETTGAALVAHPDVDKVAFTGSEAVGKLIARNASDTLKRVTLELGGKSPTIILPDADIAAASAAAAGAVFYNAGQVCSAGSRLLVDASVYDDVMEAVLQAAAGHQLGSQLAPETTMGPLVSRQQLDRVQGFIETGLEDGAQLLHGGVQPAGMDRGYFLEPTVFGDAPADARIVREEIFGPVLVAERFGGLDELIERANDTSFGLAAGVFTNDLRSAHRLSDQLQVGVVWINCYNLFDSSVPFGGRKASGYGSDSGRAALEQYLQTKSVWTNYA